jgi:hypothetical protein
MDFRLELQIKPWKRGINIREEIMLMGSCFTGHMAAKLAQHRFKVLENPHGILFNPMSIANALKDYSTEKQFSEADVFKWNGLWQSWHHHGRFADADKDTILARMNKEREEGTAFLKKSGWLFITLGSAFVYELNPRTEIYPANEVIVAANCHKVPAQYFTHRLPGNGEVLGAVQEIVTIAQAANPTIQIVFTISPVRHFREGLVENNRSKGLLHNAIGDILQHSEGVHYFPAYELIIDDLRDYRFFAEDLVHPNYLATQYVWEKFSEACIDAESRALMENINRINAAMHHKPRQPESEQHHAFLAKMKSETDQLAAKAPFLDLSDAFNYFSDVQND